MKIESMLSAAVIAFLLAHSSSVFSQQSIEDQERAAAGPEHATVAQDAVTVKKIEMPGVVEVPQTLVSEVEQDILERLKKARESGDRSTSRALISELDAMHGIEPAKEPQPDVQTVVETTPDAPLSDAQLNALQFTDDSLVNNSSEDVVRPSMVSTPEGHLFIAMHDRDYSGAVRLYRSTDGGKSWEFHGSWTTSGGSANPSIAYAVDPDTDKPYIYIVYEGNSDSAGDNRLVMALWVSTTNSSDWNVRIIKSGILVNGVGDHVFPEIATDYIQFPNEPWLYVTYAVFAIDYYPVFFSRSTDYGVSWSEPSNITGGSENTSWPARPHIAYGDAGLFVTYEKPGWTGATWATQVWVTWSGDYGDSWGAPLQLTSFEDKQYHPRVAVANGSNSVFVAYTRDYGNSGDLDINYAYSTDGGSIWSLNRYLASSLKVEKGVELTVSNSSPGSFHAAYMRNTTDHVLLYRRAETASPSVWTPEAQVDDSGGFVSQFFPKPALAVDPTRSRTSEEAAFAWSDYRPPDEYNIYFNRMEEREFPYYMLIMGAGISNP